MVALLGLFDLPEVSVELFLPGEGGTVDAGEHFALGIAAPVGARHLHQLERASHLSGRCHVRAAAQIEPVALLVDPDFLVRGDGIDQLHLEQLALVAKNAFGMLARPHFPGERLVARDDLAHLVFDRAEILRRERLVAEEIVVEAVLDHRSDGHLRTRPQGLHRLGENMGGVVADQLQRARIIAGEKLDLRITLDCFREIDHGSIERHRNGAFGERGRDALGDLDAGDVASILPARTVRKGQRDHIVSSAHSLPEKAGERRAAVG